ncbi:hypothetical protein [Crocosphaera chwakensis]|uniref:Uncharacterized protein n=1 Tax=Crocosphaera chwakensis CCY0110 TaxID=391612 RepID=A3IQ36_9CHRO|nr:hypothetical protein [Crocosphaera chwakensis]EAZ91376.1 hypothetical protein CY0110_05382 [Crocosphaera chwakensis CCY0110]
MAIKQDLVALLADINKKLDSLQKEVKDIKIDLTKAKGDREILKVEINALKEEVKEIQTSQQDRIWSLIWALTWTLIGILIATVLGFLVIGGRFILPGAF